MAAKGETWQTRERHGRQGRDMALEGTAEGRNSTRGDGRRDNIFVVSTYLSVAVCVCVCIGVWLYQTEPSTAQ